MAYAALPDLSGDNMGSKKKPTPTNLGWGTRKPTPTRKKKRK